LAKFSFIEKTKFEKPKVEEKEVQENWDDLPF
jgi:hypothetical protein